MKNIFLIIITAMLAAAFQYFLPWYTLAVPTFVIGFLGAKRKPFTAFLVGFFAVFFFVGNYDFDDKFSKQFHLG